MPYSIQVNMNGKLVSLDKDFTDPFIISELHISWWDRFKSLFKRKFNIKWQIDADRETIFKVVSLYRWDLDRDLNPEFKEEFKRWLAGDNQSFQWMKSEDSLKKD